MPKNPKPKAAKDVASPKVGQTEKRRKASSGKKPPQIPTQGCASYAEQGIPTIDADPMGGLWWQYTVGGTDLAVSPVSPMPADAGIHDLPEPRSAWIVFGSDESFLTDDDLSAFGGSGKWTAGKNVEIGDTLFFYFIAPEKAIHYVARACSEPWYDESWRQWYVAYDSMVRIEPITKADISTMFAEERFLPYFSGAKYLRPDFANRLLVRAKVAFSPFDSARDIALQRVVGRRELGDPKTVSLDDLRRLDSTAFVYEEDVEYYFVEPLLRLAGVGSQARIQRGYDLPKRKTADYAALDRGQKVLCIIEVKRELSKEKEWRNGSNYGQARDNARACKAPGFVLMDRDRIFCFRTVDEVPCLTLDRSSLGSDGLRALRAHILGQGQASASSPPRR